MRRNGLFWAITPIPTVLCRHRERQILKDGVHAAGKDAQVCAVDGVVNPAAEGFLVIDVEDEDLVFSHYFEMMRHPRLEVKGGIDHGVGAGQIGQSCALIPQASMDRVQRQTGVAAVVLPRLAEGKGQSRRSRCRPASRHR